MTKWRRTETLALVAAIGTALAGGISNVAAFPLERFDHPVEVACAEGAACTRSLRAKTTLGAYTGISVRGGADMNASFSSKQGALAVKVSDSPSLTILLSWDSDTYPDTLSSAGLKCIDMRHQGGWALVLEKFSIQGTCAEGVKECSPFVIETRIYDSADPTGQTYSASVLRRANGRETQDLLIPFSNFNRKGLRGEARLGCAGAVSMSFRGEGYTTVTLHTGQIFTNSSEPLEALVFTPTPTPIPATPTAADQHPITPSPSPTYTPNVAIAPSNSPVASEVAAPTQTAEVPQPPTLGKVVVAPLGTPEIEPERAPEEAVYGEIISE